MRMEPRERRDRVPRRSWTPLVATLAAVVAVAVVLGLWGLGRGAPSVATPAEPATPSHVSPSASPVAQTSAKPSTARTADLPRCTTDQVDPHRVGMDGAMGTEYLTVRLDLAGTIPCRLEGRPTVQLLSDGHPVEVPVHGMPSLDGFPGGPVALTPHRSALVRIGWAAGHYCGPAKRVQRVRIDLPGPAAPFVVRGFGRTLCNPGEPVPAVEVAPIEPAGPGR